MNKKYVFDVTTFCAMTRYTVHNQVFIFKAI